MKKRMKVSISMVLMIALIVTSTVTAFASTKEEESVRQFDDMRIDVTEMSVAEFSVYAKEDGSTYTVFTDDDQAEVLSGDVEIFTGSLEVKRWIGSQITFVVRVRSTLGTKLKAHSGMIGIYKTTTLGLKGSIYNSQTFRITDGQGTTTLAEEFTMNTGSLKKIYLTISNGLVYDTYGDVTSMAPCNKYFNKDNF